MPAKLDRDSADETEMNTTVGGREDNYVLASFVKRKRMQRLQNNVNEFLFLQYPELSTAAHI